MNHESKAGALAELKYRPDIDGLRAVAVAAVVAFHAFPSLLPGGFVGVDIFFVISGYLITGIILAGIDGGVFTFRDFYERRIRRIFPALTVVLLASLAFAWLTMLSSEFSRMGKHTASGAGFLANIALWSESGYFDVGEALKPLLHLWSLGVEEQFYIIWPPILILASKTGVGRKKLIGALLLISFAASGYLAVTDRTAAFYSPLSRFWELLFGAYLACGGGQTFRGPSRNSSLTSFLGAALITVALILVDRDKTFPAPWALLPVGGATLLIASGPHGWINRKILTNRMLVWLGLISYPLYLWHWPILSFGHIVRGKVPVAGFRVVAVAASILLAWATYRYLERRIRFKRPVVSVKPLVAAVAAIALTGLAAWTTVLTPRNAGAEVEKVAKAVDDWSFPGGMKQARFGGSEFHEVAGGPEKVALIGDSHVQQYGPRAEAVAADKSAAVKTAVFATSSGCPPLKGVVRNNDPDANRRCGKFIDDAYGLAASPDIGAVVIGACWNCYFITSDSFYAEESGKKMSLKSPEGRGIALSELERTINGLSESKKVFLLLDNPVGPAFNPLARLSGSRLTGLKTTGGAVRIAADPEQEKLRQELLMLAARTGAEPIDPAATLCDSRGCSAQTEDGTPVYKDETHFRPFFASQACGFLDKALLLSP